MLGGAGVLVVGRYVVAALAWVGSIIVVRQLTLDQFGRLTTIFAVLGIVGFVADLRLSRIVLRDVISAEHDEAGRIVGSYVGLRLVIGLVSYVIAMAWVLVVGYPSDVVVGTAVAGLNLIVLSVAFGIVLLFEARLWLRPLAAGNVFGQVIQFGMTVAIAASGVASILWFSGVVVANGVAVLLWVFVVARRSVRLQLGFDAAQWWVWMREAAPLALGAALDTVYFRIDIVMLSMLDTDRAVAIYGVAYKFSDLLGAVPLAVAIPALTMMIAAWPHDPARFRGTFRHALILLTVAAMGACAGFLVFAEPLVSILYGERYEVAADAARLLVVGQSLHFFTLLAFSTLVAVGRNRLYPIAMLAGVALNVGLNVALIPEYSYLGSGWATVVTESMVLVVLGLGVARIPGIRPFPVVAMAKCALAGVLAAGVGWALFLVIPWYVAAAVAASTYLAAVHVLAVNGPGGLRALAGAPRDDLHGYVALETVVEEEIYRPSPGDSSPG
ncbi:MAG: flippase [Actinobacteria bacterium]|nr:flippase [Actinomycetota bacterium]